MSRGEGLSILILACVLSTRQADGREQTPGHLETAWSTENSLFFDLSMRIGN